MTHKRFTVPLWRHPRANVKEHCKLLIGALLFPVQTRRWRTFVMRQPALTRLARSYPRVLHKIYRPYLSRHLSCSERVDAMITHFEYISQFGLTTLMMQASKRPMRFFDFRAKEEERFEVFLATTTIAHREGKWTLQLFHDGLFLFSISFSFMAVNGRDRIQVGSLQGASAKDAAQRIRAATKALYGWRPKQLMVAILRDLGAYLGCDSLLLVSNQNRVSVNWRRRLRIAADYDATWRELDALHVSDGNYQLSCTAHPLKAMSEISANKRAEVRRRRALFDVVCQLARNSFSRYSIAKDTASTRAAQVSYSRFQS